MKFIEVNGHAAIGSDEEIFEGYPLGTWCAIQRRDGKSGKLPPERKALLDEIDVWVWSLEEAEWEKGFVASRSSSATHDACLRRQSHEAHQGTLRVGAWLNFQRTRKNQGKLEPERIAPVLIRLFDNLPGMLKSIDPETGKTQWTFYSTPPPGTPGSICGGATGGQMWMTGTYDPELNLVYVGTGNPTPVLNGDMRPGDNRWTCSILALRPETGELVWGFQASPHDTHDWDAAEVPVLVDANFNGQRRKMLMQASRNGYFFVLDRTNGKNLLTTPFAAVNWAKDIDEEGRPIPEPRPGTGARRPAGRARTRAAAPTTGRPASIPRPACSSSARRMRTASTSTRRSTASTAGRAPTTVSGARGRSGRSITRPERCAGTTTSVARAVPAS